MKCLRSQALDVDNFRWLNYTVFRCSAKADQSSEAIWNSAAPISAARLEAHPYILQ